jgi:uncharacterized protein YdiU (UPF0061 family)
MLESLKPPTIAELGDRFFARIPLSPLEQAHWVAKSQRMARELGLDEFSDETLQLLSGNAKPAHGEPIATVYSGHQFGQWAGQLGDGRAVLLGELPSSCAGPMEVQLKGAGKTPFSRMGDGRAVLRSSIREFLCSEAMHGLGIPTTRALCITGSSQLIQREEPETAAVVTRIAPSFIRFGHFEHFGLRGRNEELKLLADWVIDRFYPECRDTAHPYAAFLEQVTRRTARLLAQWQAVGFCHGVMNTDNMSILGLAIDYGPFGFLDGFDPMHICNHSDTGGRYAFARQPNVAFWNLFCLGQALMPLIGEQDTALAALDTYKQEFPQALDQQLARKLGLAHCPENLPPLIDRLFKLMAEAGVDHTIFWRTLSEKRETTRDLFLEREAFDAWLKDFHAMLDQQDMKPDTSLMLRTNPAIVLRNHLAQTAIERAQQGDFSEVAQLLEAFENPYELRPEHAHYAGFPPDWSQTLQVSCSS